MLAGSCGHVAGSGLEVAEFAAEVDIPSVVHAELEFTGGEVNFAAPDEEVVRVAGEFGVSVPATGSSVADNRYALDRSDGIGQLDDVGGAPVETFGIGYEVAGTGIGREFAFNACITEGLVPVQGCAELEFAAEIRSRCS